MTPETASPIFTLKNQYRGINPHLNSLLQVDGWEAFHTHHITDLARYLTRQLRGSGYVVKLEDSLQIRREQRPPRHPEADVLIEDSDSLRSTRGAARLPAIGWTPNPSGTVAMASDPSRYRDGVTFKAVGIYRFEPSGTMYTPVAWIELLSPSNKAGGRHYRDYLQKRDDLLDIGAVVFIEIDYLHESPPTFRNCADYTRQENGSTAYRVAMAETRGLGIARGELYTAGFGVDEPIPAIPIPLHGDDIALLTLDDVYDHTYADVGYGVNDDTRVDYRQLPANIDHYSSEDQRRIAQRMLTVELALEDGIDLEVGLDPLPIDPARIAARLEK